MKSEPGRADRVASSGTSTEPEERGTLSISHTVVRKIAQRTADQVDGTTRAQRRVAGLGLGTHGSSAKVAGRADEVDLSMDLALHYPTSIGTVTGEVRERVTEEVERLTAYRVRSLRVTVSALLPEIQPRVR
ncbi:Asp23/Gls24 family envelope stress response protein [Amycolatopsis cihanbeyliensis]|uniref:Putative alkaline shock family protein YloU n=1 Tax=Amycolatopsis cihanbeyliensis TaxID=1128664 RepID=A0A542DD66_AMYCI|nr:Asp23/Gls24 family envelope stress response protein [Amycolatopsis cihanbeyliensis]TQJ01020.1 putative alkaline shock family protein YloU [Amycolatopsis cihanbeyliensis]